MQTGRSNDFAEIDENWVQRYGGDGGSHADVGYLADAAGGFIMPISMRVRGNL